MIKETLQKLILEALKKAQKVGDLKIRQVPEISLERPKEKTHGDWATNVSMVLAGQAKKPPTEIAEIVLQHLQDKQHFLEKVEVAGKGFINFYLSNNFFYQLLKEVDKKDKKFGYVSIGKGEKVQIEFVSANPVGPMHVGHGRWAALGDSLARIMSGCGFKVAKEFYINDYGSQMDVFGKSVAARYLELLGEKVSFPEDGYRGAYIKDIAQEIIAQDKDAYLKVGPKEREEIFTKRAKKQVLAHIEKVLLKMGVSFDVWFSEESLHQSGAVKETVSYLKDKGLAYDKEGAVWFRSTKFGDEKDRVLIRENGKPSYFAADIAYHMDKFKRGFKKVIDIWGADHHGYVARMKAAVEALGHPSDSFEVIIGQLVNLLKDGKPLRMSKRTGEMVTLEELLDEVGKDALRYFFLSRSTDSPFEFDIDLAKEKSAKNPVYYVQYAHARISSILKFAQEKGVKLVSADRANLKLLQEEAELDLLRKLAEFEEVVEAAATMRAPFKLTQYAESLATAFHLFYTKCRVIGNKDKDLDQARLALAKASRIVLRNTLDLLGVSMPESM